MYKGIMIHSSGSKLQPMTIMNENDTEKDQDKTDIYSKDYETRRKLVKVIDSTMKTI